MAKASKRTNSDQKDNALKPIVLRLGAELAMRKTDEALANYGFDKYKTTFDYHEIYASKGNYEYTISFIEDYGKSNRQFEIWVKAKELFCMYAAIPPQFVLLVELRVPEKTQWST